MTNTILHRLNDVREKIAFSCQKVGRKIDEVQIIAVTKGVDVEPIREAIAAGLTLFGENRLQEAEKKITALKNEKVQWHFIGRLQTNKIRKVIEYFQCIHSLDREMHAHDLEKYLHFREIGSFPILIQVNLTGKPTQGGISEENIFSLLEAIAPLRHFRVIGLMTIGPVGNENQIRRVFRRLSEIKIKIEAEKFPHVAPVLALSMGMSDDYHLAVEEGSTLLRLGRCLFGERSV